MSEYMFGVITRKMPAATARLLDQICIDEGGYGFTQDYEAEN